MASALEIYYQGVTMTVHENECRCGRAHNLDFTDPKAVYLCLATDQGGDFYQVWHRTSRWGLLDAVETLLSRTRPPWRVT